MQNESLNKLKIEGDMNEGVPDSIKDLDNEESKQTDV